MTIKEFIQLKKEKADPFLKLFPLPYRGSTTNFILYPIRAGIEDYKGAIQYLENEFKRREHWQPLRDSAKAMRDNLHSPLLESAIEYYVRYEKLPLEIKKLIKKEVMKEFWKQPRKPREICSCSICTSQD